MPMVSFVDEATQGERRGAWALEVFEERLTLRELIRRRVFQEVAEHNAREQAGGSPAARAGASALVGVAEPERVLNGTRVREPRRVDPERQFERAVAAFRRNGFVVLVGDTQVTELDEEIDLHRHSEVTFLTLVPLVGG